MLGLALALGAISVTDTQCDSVLRVPLNGEQTTLRLSLFCPEVVGCTVPRDEDFAAPDSLSNMGALLYDVWLLNRSETAETRMDLQICAVGDSQEECSRYCKTACDYHYEYVNNPITFTYNYSLSGRGHKNMSREMRMPAYFCPRGQELSPPEEISDMPSSGLVKCNSSISLRGSVHGDIEMQAVCPNAVDCTLVPDDYFVDRDVSEVGKMVSELMEVAKVQQVGVRVKSLVTVCAAGDTLQECNRLCRAECVKQADPGVLHFTSRIKVKAELQNQDDATDLELPMPVWFCPKGSGKTIVEPFPPWLIAVIVIACVWFVLGVTIIVLIVIKKCNQNKVRERPVRTEKRAVKPGARQHVSGGGMAL